MIKKIKPDNKIFNSYEFKKDKYEFFIILQNLESETLELYSDEENYILCRGDVKWPTWIWTKDNFDSSLLREIEEAIDLYRLDVDTRFTCKRELYDLLKKDNYKFLGDYYFEMSYLACNQTVKPKTTDGNIELVTEDLEDILSTFIYNESREISDTRILTLEEARETFRKRTKRKTYYIWKNNNNKIVAEAFYIVVENNAKITGVYTLPEERGKGYAANLIYNLTSKVLEEGNHVSVYTDYNYIPSNKAYKNVGYVTEDILINFSCTKK